MSRVRERRRRQPVRPGHWFGIFGDRASLLLPPPEKARASPASGSWSTAAPASTRCSTACSPGAARRCTGFVLVAARRRDQGAWSVARPGRRRHRRRRRHGVGRRRGHVGRPLPRRRHGRHRRPGGRGAGRPRRLDLGHRPDRLPGLRRRRCRWTVRPPCHPPGGTRRRRATRSPTPAPDTQDDPEPAPSPCRPSPPRPEHGAEPGARARARRGRRTPSSRPPRAGPTPGSP